MGLRPFPKVFGPPPFVWGLAMLVWSAGALAAFPLELTFLAVNAFNLTLVLFLIARGEAFLPRFERNLLLATVVILVMALYGLYQGFDKTGIFMLHLFQVIPAVIFYAARRIYAFRYAWRAAIEYAATLGDEDQLLYADYCRTTYRRRLAALQVAADIYKAIAEEGLIQGMILKPIHIAAMQKYAHMLLYGEAKGLMGEGEWYARKAHELSLSLLEESKIPATVH